MHTRKPATKPHTKSTDFVALILLIQCFKTAQLIEIQNQWGCEINSLLRVDSAKAGCPGPCCLVGYWKTSRMETPQCLWTTHPTVRDYPHNAKIFFLHIYLEFPVFQLVPTASCYVTGHKKEGPSFILSSAPIRYQCTPMRSPLVFSLG